MEIELLITCGLAIYLIKHYHKLFKEHSSWSKERLGHELNFDLKLLSKLPKEDYITLNGNEQRAVDEYKIYLSSIKEKYSSNELAHLWKWIPEGPEKNELRAKAFRIRKTIDEILDSVP